MRNCLVQLRYQERVCFRLQGEQLVQVVKVGARWAAARKRKRQAAAAMRSTLVLVVPGWLVNVVAHVANVGAMAAQQAVVDGKVRGEVGQAAWEEASLAEVVSEPVMRVVTRVEASEATMAYAVAEAMVVVAKVKAVKVAATAVVAAMAAVAATVAAAVGATEAVVALVVVAEGAVDLAEEGRAMEVSLGAVVMGVAGAAVAAEVMHPSEQNRRESLCRRKAMYSSDMVVDQANPCHRLVRTSRRIPA